MGGWLGGRRLLELHLLDHGIEREQDMFTLFVFEVEDTAKALDHGGIFEQVGIIALAQEVADGGVE